MNPQSKPPEPSPRHQQPQAQTRDKEVILRVRLSRDFFARLVAYARKRMWRHGGGWNVSRAARETMERGMEAGDDARA